MVAWNSKLSHGTSSRLERKTLHPGATKLTSEKPQHQTRGCKSALSPDLDLFTQELEALWEAFMVSARWRPAENPEARRPGERERPAAGGHPTPSILTRRALSRAIPSHSPSRVWPRPPSHSSLPCEAPHQPRQHAAPGCLQELRQDSNIASCALAVGQALVRARRGHLPTAQSQPASLHTSSKTAGPNLVSLPRSLSREG